MEHLTTHTLIFFLYIIQRWPLQIYEDANFFYSSSSSFFLTISFFFIVGILSTYKVCFGVQGNYIHICNFDSYAIK